MEIKYSLDLSRFSRIELDNLLAQGAITRHEFIKELNERKKCGLEKEVADEHLRKLTRPS